MDPNACLQRIENADTRNEERVACWDLYWWIQHGGFAPHWAMHSVATATFVRVCGWHPSMPESFRPTTGVE